MARQSADAFLGDLYEQATDLLIDFLANARRNLGRSRVLAHDFIAILRNQGLVKLAVEIEKHVNDL